MAYVKLDCGILDSTTWMDKPARDVFLTALLMAKPWHTAEAVAQLEAKSLSETGWLVPPGDYGFVAASGPGILHRAGIDTEIGMNALERLGAPEPESRSQEWDGRRLVRVNGGYVALNYDKYRTKDHTAAERQARYRERITSGVTRNVTAKTPNVTQVEVEAEVKANQKKRLSLDASAEQRTHGAQVEATAKAKAAPKEEPEFESFWRNYPKKVGKRLALAEWLKEAKALQPADATDKRAGRLALLARCRVTLPAWLNTDQWTRDGGKYILDPVRWLKRGHWDEMPEGVR